MMAHSPCRAARLLPIAVLVTLCAADAHGQLTHGGPAAAIALAATLPAYDVVSVKQDNSGNMESFNMSIHDDRFTASNVPLKEIVEFAYDIRDDLIFGLSGPVSSVSFNIEAKVIGPDGGPPPRLSDQQLQAMIIPLLAERFHLKAHLQPRVLADYDLVVARGGPKFQLSQAERKDSSWNTTRSNDDITVSSKGASMADLAAALSDEVHRSVVDKTGLKGNCDELTLKWTDEGAADAQGASTISIFTAVEEQLGLKLEPSKGPVETLVIDHAEMPSEN